VEYNIIENQVNVDPVNHGNDGGAINSNNGGTIQNNIIRNNYADSGPALCDCNQGIIRNNVIYGNRTYRTSIIDSSSSNLINNTFFNNNNYIAISSCSGEIVNNIVWETTSTVNYIPIIGSSTPHNCLLHGYTGPGANNIDADPRFVDPANGDFHLKPDSPCIGAGVARSDVKADFSGVQRGLKTTTIPGVAGATDIGAFELVPKPVAVWLQDGEPDVIAEGQALSVGWALDASAGTAINLSLVERGRLSRNFGNFWDPTGAAVTTLTLPAPLTSLDDYRIEGRSSYDTNMVFDSPPFAIQGTLRNAARRGWAAYP
jgi:hypothetical protein